MLSAAFDTLRRELPDQTEALTSIWSVLSRLSSNDLVVPEQLAELAGVPLNTVRAFLARLHTLGALRAYEERRCSRCATAAVASVPAECPNCGPMQPDDWELIRGFIPQQDLPVGVPTAMMSKMRLANATVGVITALIEEQAAICAGLEDPIKVPVDVHGRTLVVDVGFVTSLHGGRHTVAHLSVAGMGNSRASGRAQMLVGAAPNIQILLMSGISGACPHPSKPDKHVRLGDIVVSTEGGLTQFDFGSYDSGKVQIRPSNKASAPDLLDAVHRIESGALNRPPLWQATLAELCRRTNFPRPDESTDILLGVGDERIVHPSDPRRSIWPIVHRGGIASSNAVLKDPNRRDELRDAFGVRAVEMEGSGVADASWELQRGYLVVRAACDYCDERTKNDEWHGYAACAAAAYTLHVIAELPVRALP